MRRSPPVLLVAVAVGVAVAGAAACGGKKKPATDDGGASDAPPGCGLGAAQRVLPRSIASPMTLRAACSPYTMDGPVTVTAPLALEAGVRVEACIGGCDSRLTIAGLGARLTAAGSADAPIVFTTHGAESAGPGEWTGVMIRGTLEGSVLRHVIIEHGGGPTAGRPEFGADDEEVRAGLVVWDTAGVSLEDVTFRGNKHYGLRVVYGDDNNLTKVFSTFEANTFSGSSDGALRVPVNQLGLLGAGNCFAGRDDAGACLAPADARAEGAVVEADMGDSGGQFVERTATWRALGVPIRLRDGLVVSQAELTITEPAELWVGGEESTGGVTVGLSVPGALIARAKSPGGIRFLSGRAKPAAGDWDGVFFEAQTAAGKSVLENVEVAHAGRTSWRAGEGRAAVWIYGAAPALHGLHVHDSKGGAVHWNCTSNATVDGTTFENIACKPEVAQNWGCPCDPFMMCAPMCP